jgi:hypothetical protein
VVFPKGRQPFEAQLQVMIGMLDAMKGSKHALLESPAGEGSAPRPSHAHTRTHTHTHTGLSIVCEYPRRRVCETVPGLGWGSSWWDCVTPVPSLRRTSHFGHAFVPH